MAKNVDDRRVQPDLFGDRIQVSDDANSVVKAISAVVDAASLSSRDKRRQTTFMHDDVLGVAEDAVRATVQTSLTT